MILTPEAQSVRRLFSYPPRMADSPIRYDNLRVDTEFHWAFFNNPKQKEYRLRKGLVLLNFGGRETGKTTFFIENIANMVSTYKRVFIFYTNDQPEYSDFTTVPVARLSKQFASPKELGKKGLYKVKVDIRKPNEAFEAASHLRSACILWDDCATYFTGGMIPSGIRCVLEARNRDCDQILNYHSVVHPPPDVWRCSPDMAILGMTTESEEEIKKTSKITFRKTFLEKREELLQEGNQFGKKIILLGIPALFQKK